MSTTQDQLWTDQLWTDQLWNREQAAEYLGVTLRWMANTGRHLGVPQLRIGGLVRYQPSDVKLWAAQQSD